MDNYAKRALFIILFFILLLGVDFVCASGESADGNVNLSLTVGSYSEVQSRLDGGELNI